MISCQKSCRHSAKVGNFQKIKRKSVRFIFILHFTLHSNLLTFGIWHGRASTFFFDPKSSCQKKIYKFGLPIDSWPGCAYTHTEAFHCPLTHILTHERILSHPHTHNTHTRNLPHILAGCYNLLNDLLLTFCAEDRKCYSTELEAITAHRKIIHISCVYYQ